MSQTTLVTAAGIQAMINAERSGTEKVKLTSIKFGSDIIVPTQYTTDMGTIVAECSAVGGKNIGDQMIHISGADSSSATYDVYTVGVFTDTGILFAISSSDTPIINKSKLAVGAIAFDITLTSASPDVIDFGDSSFTNPPATSETEGVVRIATVEEGIKGESNSVAMTPYTVKKHIESSSAIVHRTGDETIKGKKTFETPIKSDVNGNSDTSSKWKTARKINGSFVDGSTDITTSKWGAPRGFQITDATKEHTSAKVSVDGSTDNIIPLPETIKATIIGKSTSTDKWAIARKLTLKDGNGYTNNSIVADGSKDIEITVPLGFATPVGTVMMIAGSSIPSGFLLCNGAAISRTTYAKLFAAIGTMYGAGDGATTFNLPDMRDRFAEGAGGTYSVGTAVEAGLPNITGGFWDLTSTLNRTTMGTAEGAFFTNYFDKDNGIYSIYGKSISYYDDKDGIGFDAHRASSVYRNISTVQPKTLIFNYAIKY